MACLHVQDQLEDCESPLDADLLSMPPTGTALELLRGADDELNASPEDDCAVCLNDYVCADIAAGKCAASCPKATFTNK